MSKYTGVNLINQVESTLEKVCTVLESLDSYVKVTTDATGLVKVSITNPDFKSDITNLQKLIKQFNSEIKE